MRTAFKEWAVVVDALGRGLQILILRKGGLREGHGGFQVDHDRFLLFPTRFHQQRESVLEPAQQRFDELAARWSSAETVRIEYLAEVVAWRNLESFEEADQLAGQHIWRSEVIRERFDWGRSSNIHALALRVYRLASAVELPMQPEYGGCKSWVELANDLETSGLEPVLSEPAFAAKLAQFHRVVGSTAAVGNRSA